MNTMTAEVTTTELAQYAKFVGGLFKDGAAIRQDLPKVSDWAISKFHAVVGIVGEVGELRKAMAVGLREPVIEEAGDLLFYMEALRQNLVHRNITVNFDSERAYETLLDSSLELLDLAKKEVIYAKMLSVEQELRYEQHYQLVAFSLSKLLRTDRLTIEQAIAHNVDKLRKRYPGATYSNEAAAARVDKIGVQDDNS